MTHSKSVLHVGEAIRKVQAVVACAKRDGLNDVYQHAYPTLESIWQAARAPLQKYKIAVTQSDGEFDRATLTVKVTTLATHVSGEWIETVASVPCVATADCVAAESTRLRRRALAALLGIVMEDSDGQHIHYATDKATIQDEIERLSEAYAPDASRIAAVMTALNHAQRLVLLRRGLSSDALIAEAQKMSEAVL